MSKFADEVKPKFADSTEPTLADFTPGAFAWLIQKVVEEKEQPGGRPLGISQGYILRKLQKSRLAAKPFAQFKPINFVEHCRARRATGVLPQTIMQEMTYASGVLKYAFEISEIPGAEEALAAYRKAKPQLLREQLIGHSPIRDRLPTDDEEAQLRALFAEQNTRPRNKIDMVLVMDAELLTGRRISELCRIERQHVNVVERTCWIYNLKNAKGKGYHGEFALIEGAWEFFERRLREIPNHPEARLFGFNPKCVGAKYTLAKKALGIKGLRMHDNRAECFVRLLDKGYSLDQVQKGVSLHKDQKTLSDRYVRIKAKDLHRGPVRMQPIPQMPPTLTARPNAESAAPAGAA